MTERRRRDRWMSWLLAVWPVPIAVIMTVWPDYWSANECSMRLPTDHQYWAATLAGLALGMMAALFTDRRCDNRTGAAVFMAGLFATALWWAVLWWMVVFALIRHADANPIPLAGAPFFMTAYLIWGIGECRRLKPGRGH